MKSVPARPAGGTTPIAAMVATAMARSKWVPLFGRSAGESRIVTLRVLGHSATRVSSVRDPIRTSLLLTAMRHLSRASLSTVSARPTMVVPTRPRETSTWTSMRWPTAPARATVAAVATPITAP